MIKFNVQVRACVDAFFVVEARDEAAAHQIAADRYDAMSPFELSENVDAEDFLWPDDFFAALMGIEPIEAEAKEGE